MRITRFCQILPSLTVVLTAHALITAPASAREIGRFGDFTVRVSDQNWCDENVDLEILAGAPRVFTEDRADLERSVGLARAALAFECPESRKFSINGIAEGKNIYFGTVSAADNWRLTDTQMSGYAPSPDKHVTTQTNGAPNSVSTLEGELELRRDLESPDINVRKRAIQKLVENSVDKPPLDARCGEFELMAVDGPVSLADLKRRRPNEAWMSEVTTQRNQFDARCNASIFINKAYPCDIQNDLVCYAASKCSEHILGETYNAPSDQCIGNVIRRAEKERLQVVAADVVGVTSAGQFKLFRSPGSAGRPLHWCGPTLDGSLWFQQQEKITAQHARTIKAILDESMSGRCPEARLIRVSASGGPTDIHRAFLTARREKSEWSLEIDPGWAASARTQISPFEVIISMGKDLGTGIQKATEYAEELDARADAARVQRQAKYAREGKVCKMKPSVAWCLTTETNSPTYAGGGVIINNVSKSSSCERPCAGHDGYCDMSTGQKFFSAEAAERTNCRAATPDETRAAINAAQVSSEIKPQPFTLRF